MQQCTCPEWILLFGRIARIIRYYKSKHKFGEHPLGKDWKPFRYCPWCGKRVKEEPNVRKEQRSYK